MLRARLCVILGLLALSVMVFAEPTACPETQALTFWAGSQGSVVDGISSRLRAEPSLEGEVLKELPGASLFRVEGDSVCGDNLRWWPISADGAAGWIAEGPKTNGYYIKQTETVPPDIDNSALLDLWAIGFPFSLSWSSDRSLLALASLEGIWLYSGDDIKAKPHLLKNAKLGAVELAFDPENPAILYSGNRDRTVSRLNVSDGSTETIAHFDEAIRSLFFSEVSHTLVVFLYNGDVYFLRSGDQTPEVTIASQSPTQEKYVTVALSHDESMIALGTDKGRIDLFNIQGKRLTAFTMDQGPIKAVAFSPDDSLLVGAGTIHAVDSLGNPWDSSGMRTWDLKSGAVVAEYGGEDNYIEDLVFLPDGRLLTVDSITYVYTLRIRDARTFDVIQELNLDSAVKSSLILAPDGRTLTYIGDFAQASRQRSLEQVDLTAFDTVTTLQSFPAYPGFALALDGSRLVRDDGEGWTVVDTKTGGTTLIAQTPTESSHYVISSDGRYFAACLNTAVLSWEPAIAVYDLTKTTPDEMRVNRFAATWDENPEYAPLPCSNLAFRTTPEGEQLVFDLYQPSIALAFWDFKTEKTITVAPLTTNQTSLRDNSLIIGDQKAAIIQYSSDNTAPQNIAIYDLSDLSAAPEIIPTDWQRRTVYDGNQQAAFLSDTTLLVTTGYGGRNMTLYDVPSGTPTSQFFSPSAISAMTISKDRHWIATAHEDRLIRLWSLEQPGTPIIVGQMSVIPDQLALSPDNTRLYSSGYTWDLTSFIKP